jgi:hypothetical protein
MGPVRQSDSNRVAGSDFPGRQNDRHDTSEANELTGFVAMGEASQQIRFERIDLLARITQTGDLDRGLVAELQPGSGRKTQQVEALGQNILTEPTRFDCESLFAELTQEFSVQ